jgi:hypothetical protein
MQLGQMSNVSYKNSVNSSFHKSDINGCAEMTVRRAFLKLSFK